MLPVRFILFYSLVTFSFGRIRRCPVVATIRLLVSSFYFLNFLESIECGLIVLKLFLLGDLPASND